MYNNKYSNKSRRFTQCNANSAATRPTGIITLLDPTGCRGLFRIPLALTAPTRGRDEWLSGKLQKDLSLCTLFQKGRCHAHQNCFQVHVDVSYITELRKEMASTVSCCQECGDTGSKTTEGASFLARHVPTNTKLRIVFPNGQARVLPQEKLAFTEGLEQQFQVHRARIENSQLDIPVRRVCRLHLKSFCKYGKDCKNVHLCTRLGEKFLEEPIPAPVVAEKVPAAIPVPEEEEEAPKPIPCFRVPSILRSRNDTPLTETVCPTFAVERSQDDEWDSRAHSSFKQVGEASGLGSRRGFSSKLFLFDAEIALEDSKYDQSAFDQSNDESFNSNSTSGVSDDTLRPNGSALNSRRTSLTSQQSDLVASPGRQHTIHLNALHPCSKASLVSSPACQLSPQDMQQFVSMFAI